MKLFQHLKDNYDKDCRGDIKQLEVAGLKLARYRNHLRFNLHCKHHSVTPTSVHLRSAVKGSKADNIIRKAEHALLNVRISQTIHKIKNLEKDQKRLSESIYGDTSPLPDSLKSQIKEHHEFTQLREHTKVKSRQQAKFSKLNEKSQAKADKDKPSVSSEFISKWVKNCSQRILSDPELSVLARGLGHNIAPRKIPYVDIITETESACRRLPEGEASLLRAKVVNILEHPGHIKSNITPEERDALPGLRQDESIIILPADKGRCVVVLDKSRVSGEV